MWYIPSYSCTIHCQDKRANDWAGAALVNYSTIRYHAYITRVKEIGRAFVILVRIGDAGGEVGCRVVSGWERGVGWGEGDRQPALCLPNLRQDMSESKMPPSSHITHSAFEQSR